MMAEETRNGFLSITQEIQHGQNSSVGQLFGDATTHQSSDSWSNSEVHDQNKFALETDETAPIQTIPGTSFTVPSSQGDGSLDYGKEMQGLEKLSSELDSVKQQLVADILRCQLLQVDLATQFDPRLVLKLRSTKLSCEKCQENFDESLSEEQPV